MPGIVVDTSVATKWFALEEDSPKAKRILELILQGELQLILPDTLLLELVNALYFAKDFSSGDCLKALRLAASITTRFVTTQTLLAAAVKLMYQHKLASYDAVFVALADKLRLSIVTADYRHHKKDISPQIVWLSEWKEKPEWRA